MKFIFFWLAASLVAASAQANTFADFSRTLIGFQCELGEQREIILFGEVGGELKLLSPTLDASSSRRTSVKRTSTGYRFLDTNGVTSFLSNLDDAGWTLYSSSETGVLSAGCAEAGDFPADVAKAVFDFVDVLTAEEVKLAHRRTELLYKQVAALRAQLSELAGLLDEAVSKNAESQLELQSMASHLYTALAQLAAERRRAELETIERNDLGANTPKISHYRSLFLDSLRESLKGQEGVRSSTNNIVFSSEVLFPPGGAKISAKGQQKLAKVATALSNVTSDIPSEIDWMLRIDGHTDDVPLSGQGEFADNWELSQARALSVVRYMSQQLGIQPGRMSATGFGQYQPVQADGSEEARALNRRIELTITEK